MATFATDTEKTIADFLLSEGFSNVFRGTEKDGTSIAQDSIFVFASGGDASDDFFDSSTSAVRSIGIQLIVRSLPEEEEQSRDRAFDIYKTLDHSVPSGFVRVDANPPVRLSKDDDDTYRWSINVTCQFHE